MNRQLLAIGAVVLLLTGSAAGFLATQQSRQKLGQPGVRVVNEPIYAIELGATTNAPKLLSDHRVHLPAKVLDYQSQDAPMPDIVAQTLPKDTLFGHRYYGKTNGLMLDMQVVLMGADRSSIHKPQYCLLGSGFAWNVEELSSVRIQKPHAYDLPVMKLKLHREVREGEGKVRKEAGVFVYWFVADGELTAEHKQRMWWMARDMLKTGVLQRWAYVICFAPCAPGAEDETFEQMKEFIADAVPQFHLTPGSPVAGTHAAAQ